MGVGQDALQFLMLRILWQPDITVRITQTIALGESDLGQEPPGCGPSLVIVLSFLIYLGRTEGRGIKVDAFQGTS